MLRMPLHPVALELLRDVGPMAVSSANQSGVPPAGTVQEAWDQLGEEVGVYLDGGPATEATMSRPHGICLGADGAIYIGDTSNHRVRRVK